MSVPADGFVRKNAQLASAHLAHPIDISHPFTVAMLNCSFEFPWSCAPAAAVEIPAGGLQSFRHPLLIITSQMLC